MVWLMSTSRHSSLMASRDSTEASPSPLSVSSSTVACTSVCTTLSSISSQEERLESVVQTEVHATVDEDTDSGDGEASVESLDAIRLECLDVDINQTIELALTTLTLGIVGQPGSCIVKRVHEEEGHGTGCSTAGNV